MSNPNDEQRSNALRTVLGGIDVRSLADVPDKPLDTVTHALWRLSDDLARDGDNQAAGTVEGLAILFDTERGYRDDAMENARIEVEGNGHGVHVGYDGTAQRRNGAGWHAFCGCSDEWQNPAPHGLAYATREEAEAAASRHVAETGGIWRDGLTWGGSDDG